MIQCVGGVYDGGWVWDGEGPIEVAGICVRKIQGAFPRAIVTGVTHKSEWRVVNARYVLLEDCRYHHVGYDFVPILRGPGVYGERTPYAQHATDGQDE